MKPKAKELARRGTARLRYRTVFRQNSTKTAMTIIFIFVLTAVFAPLIAPNDPLRVDVARKLEGPSASFWLGTDQLGRCIASRLIWGSRNSLMYSGIVLLITLMIGVPAGMVSGYFGGKLDSFMMRIMDIFLAGPSFSVALARAGTLGASGRSLVIAMSCVYWAAYARLVRGLTKQ